MTRSIITVDVSHLVPPPSWPWPKRRSIEEAAWVERELAKPITEPIDYKSLFEIEE